MKLIANILWFIFGGLLGGLAWIASGIVCCITVVGIPLGLQCFKFASLAFWPFGKELIYQGGTVSLIANILWLIFLGIPMVLHNLFWGIIWSITIVGIPIGKQFFKLARLSFAPFGAQII